MPLTIDQRGWITGASDIRTMPRPNIEHGHLHEIKGIIVHQTDSWDAKSSLATYKHKNANGAHFLIDKDGSIYQVASLTKKTWHVGILKSKCLAAHECSAAELKIYSKAMPSKINKIEMRKVTPLRYPSNENSIGIELVGKCILDPKYIKPGMDEDRILRLTGEVGVFEAVTPQQNAALNSLITRIQDSLHVPTGEVYSHPTVSWKNPTEAKTAEWPGR